LKRFLSATVVLAAAVAGFLSFVLPPRHLVLASSFADGTIPGILHVHSTRSDGRGTVDEIAQAAAEAGLKFVVLTDHGDATRSPERPEYLHGVLCLDAVEISTAGGHYVALDMPRAPYPLGGEARDVVEDVRRLGGFGIAAHPDSPKRELSWREWTATFDGIEFVNPDTSWRRQLGPAFGNRVMLPSRLLTLRLLSYPFRPAESIAGLIQPTRIREQWADAARRRAVVITAGADAHAQIAWKSADTNETRLSVSIPSYEASFRSMSVHIRPEQRLSGDAVADAAIVWRAIRAGHLYSAIDGLATPPAFEFTATGPGGTAREGDRIATGGPVTLHVKSNAPAGFTTSVWNGAALLSGDHHEPDFTVATPGGSGVYWVEIRADATPDSTPWMTSNPIYVGAPEPIADPEPRRPVTQMQPLLDGPSRANWRVEHDATSLAALDLPPLSESGGPGRQAQMRFGLASGAVGGQFAALVVDLPSGIGHSDRVSFTAHAGQPMRVSVQLRAEQSRWQRSVFVDTMDRDITVFFDDLKAVAGATADTPPRADVRSLLFVVDATNTKPGTSNRLFITNPSLQR
jgi:hypothetical protein